MQSQMDGDTAVLARPQAWQAWAVGKYERSLPGRRADLRTELAARILALTGRLVPPEKVHGDERAAAARVDGATFRLRRLGGLVLVRTCAYCGTGRFESPQITDAADLGYTLSAWRPLHEDCEDYSSEDLASW
jgi:hypothetical protein